MAEIEHFVDPNDKSHPKFSKISSKILTLFPSEAQLGSGRTISMTIGEAVNQGIVNNQTLGYFMARTQLFLEKIGINPKKMRFRQHLRTEMAHYATDCWDMEIHLVYGWIECVGHADRSCYDLIQHSNKSGIPLNASIRLDEPIDVDKILVEPNKKLIGPRFGKNQKDVICLLEGLEGNELEEFKASLEISNEVILNSKTLTNQSYIITKDLITFKLEKRKIYEKKIIPSVIEPSFGIGRILYALLEHSFSSRNEDEQRCVMSFKPCVAPIKVGIYRLINNTCFDPIVDNIRNLLLRINISNKVDSSSGTVGKRYARADELGLPFGITIDFQTLIDDSVTVRERDSMSQVRVTIDKLPNLIQQLVNETITWDYVKSRFPLVVSSNDEEDSNTSTSASTSTNASDEAKVIVEQSFRAAFTRPLNKTK